MDDGLIKRRLGNHILWLDPYDAGISATLLRTLPGDPDREPCFMKILTQELEPGMVAVDLGANLGYVTLKMAEIVGTGGKVYAIEPSTHNYRILQKNIKTNGYGGNVFHYQLALSNMCGIDKFYISDSTNLGGMTQTVHTNEAEEVSISTLDEFMKDKEYPNFIKMDIEGHEVEALEGAFNTLRNSPPPVKILMEIHTVYYDENHSLEKQLIKILEMGYKTKYVISAGIARPDFFVENGYEPIEVHNMGNISRAIYDDVSDTHMLIAACRSHNQYLKKLRRSVKNIVRAIMIEKK